MRPLVERNVSPARHPGAEPSEAPDDTATVRAIRGKGIVATLTPHFIVSVIVGLVTAFAVKHPDPISADVGGEARRCNESVTQLRADFTQFKAETSLHNLAIESKMNELLSRTWSVGPGQPSPAPSQLSIDVSRQIGR